MPESTGHEVGELFRQYGDRIYSLGLRMCGSPQAAEDLVQETFLRALKSWDSFEGRSEPSTWLFTIASRACGRMRRLKAGQPRRMEPLERLLPSGDEGFIQLPSGEDAEADLVKREATDAILTAIEELPLEFRLPFALKEMADLTVPEVGEVLGLKEATVKTRLHRARLRVRKAVAARLPSSPGPPPDRRREECLALLKAKQESLDRGVPFPLPEAHVCERCRSVLQTLDFVGDTCLQLGKGEMPAELRSWVERELAGNRAERA